MSDYVPIEALFDDGLGPNLSTDYRPALHDAEVIIAVDIMSGNEAIVFGRDLLRTFADGDNEQEVSVLRVGIDQDTEELEKLIALVQTVKGHHDYEEGNRDG